MASPDDLIPSAQVLTELRKAGLPGVDKAKLETRKYRHVYELIAAGRLPIELDGRLYKMRRKNLPAAAVELGVLSPPSSMDAAA